MEYNLISCEECEGTGYNEQEECKCSNCWGSGLVTEQNDSVEDNV